MGSIPTCEPLKPSACRGALIGRLSDLQLEEHIVRLREELDRESEERSYFQLERDKIHSFWEISKRSLEEVQAQLRNRAREREEAKERHRVEITVSCTHWLYGSFYILLDPSYRIYFYIDGKRRKNECQDKS